MQPPLQLPPILGSSPVQIGPSGSRPGSGTQQGQEELEEEDSGSPKKRRRVMGIDNVLQR